MAKFCLALLLVVAPAFAEPSWVAEVEPLLAEPGHGAAVVEVLERLPLPERQTAAYHALLARAYQAADRPGPAAEAAATCALLDPRGEQDLTLVRVWLAERAQALATQARDAETRQDSRAALRAFLSAAKCQPALLAADPSYSESALAALARAARAHPDHPALRFQCGFLSYLHGQLAAAAAAFRAAAAAERDPYRAWRARTWQARAEWEANPAPRARPGGAPSMDGVERTR